MTETKVDRELLLQVAKNARITLTEHEIQAFLPQLQEILHTFNKIAQVNVENTEPAFHPIPLQNRWRKDETKPCLNNETALKNAKHQQAPYFKGPKAMD